MTVPAFLRKLFALVTNENSNIVGWHADGLFFEIHNPELLASHVLVKYFKHGKYSSFQRQLNYFGFIKVNGRRNVTAYQHQFFLRGEENMLELIKRKTNSQSEYVKTKGHQRQDQHALTCSPSNTNRPKSKRQRADLASDIKQESDAMKLLAEAASSVTGSKRRGGQSADFPIPQAPPFAEHPRLYPCSQDNSGTPPLHAPSHILDRCSPQTGPSGPFNNPCKEQMACCGLDCDETPTIEFHDESGAPLVAGSQIVDQFEVPSNNLDENGPSYDRKLDQRANTFLKHQLLKTKPMNLPVMAQDQAARKTYTQKIQFKPSDATPVDIKNFIRVQDQEFRREIKQNIDGNAVPWTDSSKIIADLLDKN